MIRPLKTTDKKDLICYWLSKDKNLDIKKIRQLINNIFRFNYPCYIMDEDQIKGFVLVQPVEKEKELTILSDGYKISYKLLKYLTWYTKTNLYIHFDQWNSMIKLLKKFGFRIYSTKKDSRFDLIREFNEKYYFPKKGKNYDHK